MPTFKAEEIAPFQSSNAAENYDHKTLDDIPPDPDAAMLAAMDEDEPKKVTEQEPVHEEEEEGQEDPEELTATTQHDELVESEPTHEETLDSEEDPEEEVAESEEEEKPPEEKKAEKKKGKPRNQKMMKKIEGLEETISKQSDTLQQTTELLQQMQIQMQAGGQLNEEQQTQMTNHFQQQKYQSEFQKKQEKFEAEAKSIMPNDEVIKKYWEDKNSPLHTIDTNQYGALIDAGITAKDFFNLIKNEPEKVYELTQNQIPDMSPEEFENPESARYFRRKVESFKKRAKNLINKSNFMYNKDTEKRPVATQKRPGQTKMSMGNARTGSGSPASVDMDAEVERRRLQRESSFRTAGK